MIWVESAIVLACIFFGARSGGLALGTVAALGLALLVFILRRPPGEMPVDVVLIIVAVVSAAAALQAAGGLDLMVRIAEGILRAKPGAITFVAPAVSWLFTLFAGTGHVAYALLPVIAETSRKAGVRPERPMSISVIASQQSITASPISAATAGMIALFAVNDVNLGLAEILMICIPSTFVGSMIGALAVSRVGKKLADDPIYQDRLAKGLIQDATPHAGPEAPKKKGAGLSVAIFLAASVGVVALGLFDAARPITGWKTSVAVGSVRLVEGVPHAFTVNSQTNEITYRTVSAAMAKQAGWIDVAGLDQSTGIIELKAPADSDRLLTGDMAGLRQRLDAGDLEIRSPKPSRVSMAPTIEIVMLAAAALMMLLCGAGSQAMITGSIARAGVVAVVSIMGIAWLGSTFFESNRDVLVGGLADTVRQMPWTFSLALFALSVLLYSQAATVAALMIVGLQLGIEPKYLIAMFPAVNGYFFLPTYGTIVAAIQFDQTGTTRVGRYVLNHSFMLPGLVATACSIGVGFLLAAVLL